MMKQVTKDEFYAVIGMLDVLVSVRGQVKDKDYGTDFKLRNGKLVGRTVAVGDTPHYKPRNEYFLVREEVAE